MNILSKLFSGLLLCGLGVLCAQDAPQHFGLGHPEAHLPAEVFYPTLVHAYSTGNITQFEPLYNHLSIQRKAQFWAYYGRFKINQGLNALTAGRSIFSFARTALIAGIVFGMGCGCYAGLFLSEN